MVHAPMRLSRLALPAMRAGGGGRIVNVSSITGRVSSPFAGHYTAAKHALEALSDALRMEVAGRGSGDPRRARWVQDRHLGRGRARHRQAEGRRVTVRGCVPSVVAGSAADRSDHGRPGVGARSSAPLTLGCAHRYLVGRDAQAMLLADSLTPTFVKDRVIRFGLGI